MPWLVAPYGAITADSVTLLVSSHLFPRLQPLLVPLPVVRTLVVPWGPP